MDKTRNEVLDEALEAVAKIVDHLEPCTKKELSELQELVHKVGVNVLAMNSAEFMKMYVIEAINDLKDK